MPHALTFTSANIAAFNGRNNPSHFFWGEIANQFGKWDQFKATTYPFHPRLKNVIALFKENEQFKQIRGLIELVSRLLRSVWDRQANDVFLIGPQHFDRGIDNNEGRNMGQLRNPHPGLSEGYFLRLQNAYDILEAKRRIAAQLAKIKPYRPDKAA